MVAVLAAIGIGAGFAQPKADPGKADFRAPDCARYTEPAKKDACVKRVAERKAAREARQKELNDKVAAACLNAGDKAKCQRDERARLRGKARAKAKDKKSGS